MTITLSPDARARLDQHLDAVEAALTRAGNTREQRRAIADDLESQILDMLAARSSSPTPADLDAILAQLDPPAAYAAPAGATATAVPTPPPFPTPTPTPVRAAISTPPAPVPPATTAISPPRQRYSRTAIWGCICVLVPLGVTVLMSILLVLFALLGLHHTVFTPSPNSMSVQTANRTFATLAFFPCTALLFLPLALLGTLLGWIAFLQIRHSHGQLTGTGLALFDGLLWPALFLLTSISHL